MKAKKPDTASSKAAWNPVRRGAAYCSPACGAGCTWREYKEAQGKSNALAKRLGALFEPDVSENLGWHYGATCDANGCRIHVVEYTESDHSSRYTAYLNEQGECGGKWVGSGGTPVASIQDALRKAKAEQKLINGIVRGCERAIAWA